MHWKDKNVTVSILLIFVLALSIVRYMKWSNSDSNNGGSPFIIRIVSKNGGKSEINNEQKIRLALDSRSVAHYIRENSIRLNWHTSNLVTKKRPTALIMVTSTPEATKERMTIRETWARFGPAWNAQIVFFMGLPQNGEMRNICLESILYDDIVVDDFFEDFYKLSIKVLKMFKWFIDFYQNSEEARPKFLVKVDQDTFLHVPNIVLYLESLENSTSSHDYFGGLLHVNSRVTRTLKSRFFVPLDFYQKSRYPPYVGGSCYFVSDSLVPKIFQASLKVPLFHLEDVYISGMIVHEHLGIPLHGLSNQVMVESPKNLQKILKFKNNIWKAISYHRVDPTLMKHLYSEVSRHINSTAAAL